MVVFLALHPLLVPSVSVGEAGGVDDVVEGVDGQVQQLQVGHGDPGATHRHRRLQSKVSKANEAASISSSLYFFILLLPDGHLVSGQVLRHHAVGKVPRLDRPRDHVVQEHRLHSVRVWYGIRFCRSDLLGTVEGFKVCRLGKFLNEKL